MHPRSVNEQQPQDGGGGGDPPPAGGEEGAAGGGAPGGAGLPPRQDDDVAGDDLVGVGGGGGGGGEDNGDVQQQNHPPAAVMDLTDARSRRHFPGEQRVVDKYYRAFLASLFSAMITVFRPHIGNNHQRVEQWRALTAWAFGSDGPLSTFKQWGGEENRRYIKLRTSLMAAVEALVGEHARGPAHQTEVTRFAVQIDEETRQDDAQRAQVANADQQLQQNLQGAEESMNLGPANDMNRVAGLGLVRNNNVGSGKLFIICTCLYDVFWNAPNTLSSSPMQNYVSRPFWKPG